MGHFCLWTPDVLLLKADNPTRPTPGVTPGSKLKEYPELQWTGSSTYCRAIPYLRMVREMYLPQLSKASHSPLMCPVVDHLLTSATTSATSQNRLSLALPDDAYYISAHFLPLLV